MVRRPSAVGLSTKWLRNLHFSKHRRYGPLHDIIYGSFVSLCTGSVHDPPFILAQQLACRSQESFMKHFES
jgi:hypothetical protein